MKHLWLRAETKPHEQRTPLTPEGAQELLTTPGLDLQITVERCKNRVFRDEEYEAVGCKLAPFGSWRQAPKEAIIFGLKELPEEEIPLIHRHIYFAHCYKNQRGWKDILNRFKEGNGTLYDLEFLVDENGRRVAAFGYWAGYVGAAIGLDAWAYRQSQGTQEIFPKFTSFSRKETLIRHLKDRVEIALKRGATPPRALVIGAKGRCGTGAVDLLKAVGVEPTQWDMEETKKGGPFAEILDFDILVNSVYLRGKIAPFVTKEMLSSPGRRLSIVSDVSCDPTSPDNPLPIYNAITTFDHPATRVIEGALPLDVIAIDHLPSALPRESSESFGADLLPHLKSFPESPVWTRADTLFREKLLSLEPALPIEAIQAGLVHVQDQDQKIQKEANL